MVVCWNGGTVELFSWLDFLEIILLKWEVIVCFLGIGQLCWVRRYCSILGFIKRIIGNVQFIQVYTFGSKDVIIEGNATGVPGCLFDYSSGCLRIKGVGFPCFKFIAEPVALYLA